jgi:competence protein ComEC
VLLAAAGWLRLDVETGGEPECDLARNLGEARELVKLRGVVASDPQAYSMPPAPLAGPKDRLGTPLPKTPFDLEVREVLAEGRWRAACGRVRVALYGPPANLRYGDAIEVAGKAQRIGPPTNPGQLDTARLLRRRGIRVGMAAEPGSLRVTDHHRGGLLRTVAFAAKGWLRHRIQDDWSRSGEAASLLRATLLGDRMALDDDLEEKFKRSGTMHLLAISGLHVGVLAWMVWTVSSLAGLGRGASGGLVLGAAVLYAVGTGAPPSVVRATLMTAVLVGSILWRRRLDLLQATACAALVLLVARPSDLFHVGFQLSFAAVVSIICLCEEVARLLRPREKLVDRLTAPESRSAVRRGWRWLRRRARLALSVSVAAWLGVFPLTAWYFNLFSPVTVLANLVAVPLLGLVLVLGVVHTAFALISGLLAAAPAVLVQGATSALTSVVEGAEGLPLAWTYCATPALGWVAGYYALGVLVVARRRIGLRGTHAAALWVGGLLVYVLATFAPPRPDGLEVTVLDVRHGSAAVLRYPDGATVVCDCGSYGRSDVGRWTMSPALWHSGVRRIDLLIVSHADQDHTNGIPALIDRFPIGQVLYSPVVERSEAGGRLLAMLAERGIPHQAARAGDRIEVGSNMLEVLAPLGWTLRAAAHNQNENSLVIRAEHGGRRILLAGDIQDAASTALLHTPVDLAADVLLVPHHGCPMGNTEALARAVGPAHAICSNRAEHLPRETVEAYEDAGAQVWATCWDGAVTVRVRDGSIEVAPYRVRAKHPEETGTAARTPE